METSRGFFGAPRFKGLLAGALIGAGLFILVLIVLSVRHRRAAESVADEAEDLRAVVLVGTPGDPAAGAAVKRLALARDIDSIAAAGAKAIVLEAWLDEPSQAEAQRLLDQVLTNSGLRSPRSLGILRAHVAELRTRLNADSSLAKSISLAANVILPVEMEAVSAASSLAPEALPQTAVKGVYQVTRRGMGAQKLDLPWRPKRLPLESFRNAASGLGGVSADLAPGPGRQVEVPAVYQTSKGWVNALALDAARRSLELPAGGLHFVWMDGALSGLELKGSRLPFSSRGVFWIPKSVRITELEGPLDSPATGAALKGKIVFYRPQSEPGMECFDRQRQLFAALITGKVAASSGNQTGSLQWLLLVGGCLLGAGLAGLAWRSFKVSKGG